MAQAVGATQARGGGIDAAEERKIAETVAASGAPSVSVAVVEHGQVTYAKAFGKAALEPARAADANTRYAMGSISKQFTVAAILLAAEQGKLSLDDKVSKYFPDFTRANELLCGNCFRILRDMRIMRRRITSFRNGLSRLRRRIC